MRKPSVAEVYVPAVEIHLRAPVLYPEVAKLPEPPSRITIVAVESMVTLENVTVICFTPDGSPVKSIDDPDVDATGVPRVSPLEGAADHVGAPAPPEVST